MKKKHTLLLIVINCALTQGALAQQPRLVPIPARVSVEQDSAKKSDIIDGQWVAIGIKKPNAIQYDYSHLFNGKPSYRFSLEKEDNTLADYGGKGTKGRAELSYAYATHDDFKNLPEKVYHDDLIMKGVYLHGKGMVPQGSSNRYTFSFYLPTDFPSNTNTIFAQWHGMPDRTVVTAPNGKATKLSVDEFVELSKRMLFKNDKGYDKIQSAGKDGNITYKAADKPNGWRVEQGGYPPLAFGFSDGYFYIKANSESSWMTDNSDRTNANVIRTAIMQPVKSAYKASTIAYKLPFEDFPKGRWITFNINITWSKYGGEAQTIIKPGKLDVQMTYKNDGKDVKKHIVDNQEILVGRNDDNGYYFKFGIYRVGSSTVPVHYNLAGFSQQIN
jgi:heparin lyase